MTTNTPSANDQAAVRRIWIKLALIAVVIGVWYVQTTYFAKKEVAQGDSQPTVVQTRPTVPEIKPPAAEQHEESSPKTTTSVATEAKPSTDLNNPIPKNSTATKTPGESLAVNEPTKTSNPTRPPPSSGSSATTKPKTSGVYVEGTTAYNVVLKNLDDEVIYRGSVELGKTVDRVLKGNKLSEFQHDGVIFRNRERRLPIKNEGYYHEWVHPTPQVRGPGPQRIITGQGGDVWYTPDHYGHFYRVPKS